MKSKTDPKVHTTNYYNTFIQVADDCPAVRGERPPVREANRSAATMQFELISQNPYQYTSDDVLFEVYAEKKDVTNHEREKARADFFSKGQPCFRASPLTKRYGWGVHFNEEGKIALYGMEADTYDRFVKDKNLKQVSAVRSKRER